MAPAYAKSDGKAAGKLLGACGMRLDQWQGDMLVDWMARDAAGRGMSYLRRVGASAEWQVSAGAGAGRCGMLLFRERVIYTAHLQKTATETFEELRDFSIPPSFGGMWPEVRLPWGGSRFY